MKGILRRAAAGFDPGYFSFVMATGIVAVSAYLQHMESMAAALFILNKIAYAILMFLLILRGLFFAGETFSDMTSPSRAPSLFTVTAGTCILGSEFLVLSKNFYAGLLFWAVGLFLWAVLSSAFFTAVITRKDKNGADDELNGSWLLFVVGTQAASVITALLVPFFKGGRDVMLLAAASLNGAGTALYALLIVLISRRMMFLSMPAEMLSPPYWINMGAGAISTLAGAELLLHAGYGKFVQEILPALEWSTLMMWAVTTWWIPLIVLLNVWRYAYKRFPVRYDVQHWSMVFPLGMYAAGSHQFGMVAGLAPLLVVSRYLLYVALAAWITVFIAMIAALLKKWT